jgi:hypothetical protein
MNSALRTSHEHQAQFHCVATPSSPTTAELLGALRNFSGKSATGLISKFEGEFIYSTS